MSDPTPPPPAPPPSAPASSADVTPTVLQAALTFVGGIVLAAGSCAGFLATLDLNRESTASIVFALGFFASLLAALVGVALVIVRQVRLVRRKRDLRARVLAADLAAMGAPAPGSPAPAVGAAGVIERGAAWTALVVAGVLLAAAVGFVVVLVATDTSPVAFLFLVLAAASFVGSVLSLVIAAIRYGRGR